MREIDEQAIHPEEAVGLVGLLTLAVVFGVYLGTIFHWCVGWSTMALCAIIVTWGWHRITQVTRSIK